MFHVNSTTGAIVTLERLDREQTAIYHLTLVARDSSPTEPRASAVNLTISVSDLNDNTPRFSSPRYTAYVPDSTNKGMVSKTLNFSITPMDKPITVTIIEICDFATDRYHFLNYILNIKMYKNGLSCQSQKKTF